MRKCNLDVALLNLKPLNKFTVKYLLNLHHLDLVAVKPPRLSKLVLRTRRQLDVEVARFNLVRVVKAFSSTTTSHALILEEIELPLLKKKLKPWRPINNNNFLCRVKISKLSMKPLKRKKRVKAKTWLTRETLSSTNNRCNSLTSK